MGTRGGGNRPEKLRIPPRMNAPDDTPRNGENVSDVSASISDIEDVLTDEVIECRQLLREMVRSDADLEDVQVRVKEARARLQFLERAVEKGEIET